MDQSYQQEPEEEMDAQADDPMLCDGGAARAKQTREEFEHRGDMDDLELLELLRPAKRHRGAVSGLHEDTGTSESMDEPHASASTSGRPSLGVTLGTRTFPSPDAVKRYLNTEVLPSLQPDETVTGEAAEVLAALFTHHPNHSAKLDGHTVQAFFVGEVRLSHLPAKAAPLAHGSGSARKPAQKCFWLRRSDGWEDDFSVNRCCEAFKAKRAGLRVTASTATGASIGSASVSQEGTAASEPENGRAHDLATDLHMRNVLKAFMGAIMPHLIWFRNHKLKRLGTCAVCPYSGEDMTHANAVAVNELPLTNARLIKEWMKQSNLTFADIKVLKGEPGQPRVRQFADRSVYEGWKKFYLEKSKLTLASRQGYRGRVMVEALGALSMKVDA